MARTTLFEAYARAVEQGIFYTRNRDRWQFLLESYMGGETYRAGAHLTRYVLESDAEYSARLRRTPLDNHCRSVIAVYISFMFREPPARDLGLIDGAPGVEDFLKDCDFDGRSLDAFMKEVSTWASVFGHAWILMTKPSVPADSLADQIAQGVRPYVNLLTPLTVTDWRWQRDANGQYRLVYFKYIEDINDTVTTIREWDEEVIRTITVDTRNSTATLELEEPNQLGRIPCILVYNHRSQVRGIGLGDIDDIADQQRAIYNELSEVEQSIRLDGHPSLVKTPDTQIGAGAGAIIEIPENLDPGLKPYMLNADGTPIDMIYRSIGERVASIDRMANTGAVRAVETRDMSGIAMQTEFQLLNAKLAEKAANMELAEEQLWRLWCHYQGYSWTGDVQYPASFNITDLSAEYAQLRQARDTATSPGVLAVIDQRLMTLLDPDAVATPVLLHPETTPGTREAHIQEMIMEGLEDTQMLALHPELEQADIDQARQALLTPGE